MAALRAFKVMPVFFFWYYWPAPLSFLTWDVVRHVSTYLSLSCGLVTGRLQLSTTIAIHERTLEVTEALLVTLCIIITFSLMKVCFFIMTASFLFYLNWILLVNLETLGSFGRRACVLRELSSTLRRDGSLEISPTQTKPPALDLKGALIDLWSLLHSKALACAWFPWALLKRLDARLLKLLKAKLINGEQESLFTTIQRTLP